jgi:murein hydrolase activator
MKKSNLHKIAVTALLILCCALGFAKKNKVKTVAREELEKQRINILAEIKQTQEQLGDLQKSKTVTVQQLLVLQNKLDARKHLIDNINKEMGFLEESIQSTNSDVENLTTTLANLKKQYAELIRFSYKQRISQSLLMFFFSSKSFNDAIHRYQYIKQYKEYRKRQAQEITNTSDELLSKIGDLSEQKKEKDAILAVQQQQQGEIAAETNLKNASVLQIKGKEAELTKQLDDKKKIASNLNNAISTAIRREIEMARRKAELERQQKARQEAAIAKQKAKDEAQAKALAMEADRKKLADQNRNITAINKAGTKTLAKSDRNKPSPKNITNNSNPRLPNLKENANTNVTNNISNKTSSEPPRPTVISKPPTPTATTSNYTNDLSNNVRQLSAGFENNKGFLPNPVSGGYICEKFGKVKHPLYNVYTENFGVDIRTSKGTVAKSIFAGEVSSVFTLPGTGTNVLVNHGTYFTVYSKLENVTVTKGQQIAARQNLGTVRTNEEGNTQVHLEIWKVGANGTPVKLNPEQWISR